MKDLINVGIEEGIIVKGGSWISYKDIKVQGIDKFEQLVADNEELHKELEQLIKAKING